MLLGESEGPAQPRFARAFRIRDEQDVSEPQHVTFSELARRGA